MKRIQVYVLYGMLSTALLMASCNKSFLDRPSLNNPTLDTYYNTPDEVNGATSLLYNQVWYDFIDKAFHCIGEVYSGNMLTSAGDPNYGNNTYVYMTVQATDGQDLNAWNAFYKVVGNANVLINTFQQKKAQVSDPAYLNQGIAEARFIRGVAYFYIGRVYGDAPIITDPVALADSGNFNVPRYYQEDVLKFALQDLEAAEAGLPATPYQPGRVTKYSAIGMEAKLFLYLATFFNQPQYYDSAAVKAREVIDYAQSTGNIALNPDYLGMFTNPDIAKASKETLFALQWVASGGYSYANAIQAYAGPAPLLKPDFNTGYSSVIPTLDLLNAYQSGDLRKSWSVMQQGFHRADWKNVNFPNGFTYDTMPGGQPDDAYHITTGTRSNSLKYVIGPKSTGFNFSSQGGNDMPIYILRYADVLLIYAEAVLGTQASTSDPSALAAFNAVHERAGLSPVSSLTKDMIMYERRVEFAFEGDYWFDIQRQGFAKAQQIINAQERGTLNGDGSINHLGGNLHSSDQLFMPIPSDEVLADPELAQPPVHYHF